MLPERYLELLTAFVDGELSSRQQKLVMRLLDKSREAQQILKDLQDNARQVQQLPQRKLDAAFVGQVVQAINTQRSAAKPSRQSAARRRAWPVWTRYAVAASVLAVLAGGLIWLANQRPHLADPNKSIAKQTPTPEIKPRADHSSLVAKIVEGVADGYAQPLRPERPGVKLAFEELIKTQPLDQLMGDMTKQRAVHLDVAAANQRQAVQRLETVLQNKGIHVVLDPPVDVMLKGSSPLKTEFVIYAENIRPDELAAMLYELGTDERARTSIEALTVSNVTEEDQIRLSDLLGVRLQELREPPAVKQPLKTFIPKEAPAPDTPQANPIRTAATEVRTAMVLANEARAGRLSSQVQYFISQRRQLQPGALQVIVVLHQT